jgi:hypothetical protein
VNLFRLPKPFIYTSYRRLETALAYPLSVELTLAAQCLQSAEALREKAEQLPVAKEGRNRADHTLLAKAE